MKIHTIEPYSIDWAKAHIGLVSASEFGNLVTAAIEPRTGDMPKSYLYKKAAEVFRGEPMCMLSPNSAFTSAATEQGLLIEEEVLPFIALTYDADVRRAGFCTHDNGLAGCSPDALEGEDGGIEVKSPYPETHVKYLLGGCVPNDYIPQVQFSLYVTGRDHWRFVSYRRRFPALNVIVHRDETVMVRIDGIVREFNEKLTTAVNKLKSLKS